MGGECEKGVEPGNGEAAGTGGFCSGDAACRTNVGVGGKNGVVRVQRGRQVGRAQCAQGTPGADDTLHHRVTGVQPRHTVVGDNEVPGAGNRHHRTGAGGEVTGGVESGGDLVGGVDTTATGGNPRQGDDLGGIAPDSGRAVGDDVTGETGAAAGPPQATGSSTHGVSLAVAPRTASRMAVYWAAVGLPVLTRTPEAMAAKSDASSGVYTIAGDAPAARRALAVIWGTTMLVRHWTKGAARENSAWAAVKAWASVDAMDNPFASVN